MLCNDNNPSLKNSFGAEAIALLAGFCVRIENRQLHLCSIIFLVKLDDDLSRNPRSDDSSHLQVMASACTRRRTIAATGEGVEGTTRIIPRLATMSRSCGMFETPNMEDALGTSLLRGAIVLCSDCAVSLCQGHGKRWDSCGAFFCRSCRSFYSVPPPEGPQNERRQVIRKNACTKVSRSCKRKFTPPAVTKGYSSFDFCEGVLSI